MELDGWAISQEGWAISQEGWAISQVGWAINQEGWAISQVGWAIIQEAGQEVGWGEQALVRKQVRRWDGGSIMCVSCPVFVLSLLPHGSPVSDQGCNNQSIKARDQSVRVCVRDREVGLFVPMSGHTHARGCRLDCSMLCLYCVSCATVLLQEDAPLLAVYCTFSTEVPGALLEALAADLQGLMLVRREGGCTQVERGQWLDLNSDLNFDPRGGTGGKGSGVCTQCQQMSGTTFYLHCTEHFASHIALLRVSTHRTVVPP